MAKCTDIVAKALPPAVPLEMLKNSTNIEEINRFIPFLGKLACPKEIAKPGQPGRVRMGEMDIFLMSLSFMRMIA